MKIITRSYRELKKLRTFDDRYRYLELNSKVGDITFGYDRILNQLLYTSGPWRRTRDDIIIRDNGCDLGIEDYKIYSRILVHHINPITVEDVEEERDIVYDPDNLICTTLNTHSAIHYGTENLLPRLPIERQRNDTCPWLK